MSTIYTSDHGLGDFIVGMSTGAGYNFASRLGASCRQPVSGQVVATPVRYGYVTSPSPAPYCSGYRDPLEDFIVGTKLPMRPREPNAFEKLFGQISLGPADWFQRRSEQLVKTKAWSILVVVCALLAAACIAKLGWGSSNLWTQAVMIGLGFAGGALAPYATLVLCSGVLIAYAFLMLGLLLLGMIAIGLLIAAAALASAGGAIYGLLLLVGAM